MEEFYFPTITVAADHLRLFYCMKKEDYKLSLTVTAPVQLKIAGDIPENISPLVCGLSFT